MLTEIQDRDAIVSRAIAIASAEERQAYIAGACGNDAALRQQVEEKVAAHFRSSAPNPSASAAPRTGRHPRGLVMAGGLVLLSATALLSASWAVWSLHTEGPSQEAAQQAVEERDQARKAEAEAKSQRDQALAARKTALEERDQALTAEKAAKHSEQDSLAVLTFLQNNVLAAGHSTGWGGAASNKNVTLRQAVDAAELKVADTFKDRPLLEASVRAILGSTYLDLGEATLAIRQLERALALREYLLGPGSADTGDCRNKLAVAYRLADRPDEASRLFEQNPQSASHATALGLLGSMLLAQKKPAQAASKLSECLAIRQKYQPDDWSTFDAKSLLGEALLEQKKYADAEPLLLSGYEGLKQRQAKIPSQDKPHLAKALERLVRLYEAWGKKDQAAHWRKELEAVKVAKKV